MNTPKSGILKWVVVLAVVVIGIWAVGSYLYPTQKGIVEDKKEAVDINAKQVNIECKEKCCNCAKPKPAATPAQPTCQNECFPAGAKRCADCVAGNQYWFCGNYNADSCLEWSQRFTCPTGQICQNGQCIVPLPACQNECSYVGQSEGRCGGNYIQKRTCGSYDSDSCLDWSNWINEQSCGNDVWTNNYRCSGNWLQREVIRKGCSGNSCYSYSEWQNYQSCDGNCKDGRCVTSPHVSTDP